MPKPIHFFCLDVTTRLIGLGNFSAQMNLSLAAGADKTDFSIGLKAGYHF